MFATRGGFQYEEVNVAIVVCHCGMEDMAHSRCGSEQPNPRREALIQKSENTNQINAYEPQVSCQAVENSSQACVIISKPCELSVGGVHQIGDYQQEHADYIGLQIRRIEQKPRGNAYEYAEYGYHVRRYVQLACQHRTSESQGTIKQDVYRFFGILGLQSVLHFYLFTSLHNDSVLLHICFAASCE